MPLKRRISLYSLGPRILRETIYNVFLDWPEIRRSRIHSIHRNIHRPTWWHFDCCWFRGCANWHCKKFRSNGHKFFSWCFGPLCVWLQCNSGWDNVWRADEFLKGKMTSVCEWRNPVEIWQSSCAHPNGQRELGTKGELPGWQQHGRLGLDCCVVWSPIAWLPIHRILSTCVLFTPKGCFGVEMAPRGRRKDGPGGNWTTSKYSELNGGNGHWLNGNWGGQNDAHLWAPFTTPHPTWGPWRRPKRGTLSASKQPKRNTKCFGPKLTMKGIKSLKVHSTENYDDSRFYVLSRKKITFSGKIWIIRRVYSILGPRKHWWGIGNVRKSFLITNKSRWMFFFRGRKNWKRKCARRKSNTAHPNGRKQCGKSKWFQKDLPAAGV